MGCCFNGKKYLKKLLIAFNVYYWVSYFFNIISLLMPNDFFTSLFGQFHFQLKGMSGVLLLLSLLLLLLLEIPAFNANSVDPDQTPRSAVSDLGLHCLPVSLLSDARR